MLESKMAKVILDLPMLLQHVAGTPKEREPPKGEMEEIFVPGGLMADSKFSIIAAAMWPLRFG